MIKPQIVAAHRVVWVQYYTTNTWFTNMCEIRTLSCCCRRFGCCLDGATAAAGSELEGCPECEASDVCDCNVTKFGCCPDGQQPAFGPDNQGCDLDRE